MENVWMRSISCIFYVLFLSFLVVSCASMSTSIGSPDDAIQTDHYQFYASKTAPFLNTNWPRNVPRGWKPNEMMVGETVIQLDDIWKFLDEYLEGNMPQTIKFYISHEGIASTAVRGKEIILVSAIHYRNENIEDILDRVAHESCHLGLYHISKGKIIESHNKFIDEAIAFYAGHKYAGRIDWLNETSDKIVREDLKAGRASMEYLRDWQNNVREKQKKWIRTWKKKNPHKIPVLKDFMESPYRTYWTAYNFSKFFNEKYGHSKLLEIVKSMGESDISVSFRKIVGQSLDDFVSEWHASLK
jgi:hypothetical protein